MWFDAARNLLVYDSHAADQIAQQVDGAKRLLNGYVAVPASLYNLQVLRFIGLDVPPVMDRTYDWPGRYKPFEAQRVTANFLTLNPRAFVLSDMGTGKTLAALWAADYVMSQYQRGVCRALVVSPLSTLKRVWEDAVFHNFLGRRSAVILHGSKAKRLEALNTPADFYIINFDGLEVIEKELAERSDIRMAIVDEASAYRAHTTARHKTARRVLQPKDYLWMMTGTPIPNGPTDAYGMAKLVNNAGGESYRAFEDRVTLKIGMFKRIPKPGAQEEAYKLLSPAVRFAIEDCVDLPPITVQQREIALSTEQAKAYKEMKRDMQLLAKQGAITAANEAVLRLKLIQIACGAVYGPNKEVHHLDTAPRLSALREVIEQSSHKVIVFAPLTSVLAMLSKELKDIPHAVINGAVSAKERDVIIQAFRNDVNPRVLLADPATMAHGLTLVEATTVVWYAPTDRTELYLQANKRIHRPGQKHACAVVQLAATAGEREIYRRLEANETMQGLLLKMVRDEL